MCAHSAPQLRDPTNRGTTERCATCYRKKCTCVGLVQYDVRNNSASTPQSSRYELFRPKSFRAWRETQAGKTFAIERRRRASQFATDDAKRRCQSKKDSELDQLLGINTPDPLSIFMETAGVNLKSKTMNDTGYNYPSTTQLKEAFGPGLFTAQPSKDSLPPRNPHMMPCISWQRRGECDKFYNTGWCPFDHPTDQNEDLVALSNFAAMIGRWLDVSFYVLSPCSQCLCRAGGPHR